MIYLSFNLKSLSKSLETNDILEKNYQTVYKPITKFLYSHPDFKFSFSFTGNQILFYKKKHNEFISILKQLIDRKQLEIFGGGFYDPILPLLYSADRNGQIDMLSTEIRQTTGKRPRGISLFADAWDSSLVNNLQTCGIEYVLMDSNLIPKHKRKFLPLIMNELTRNIEIFPCYENYIPDTDVSVETYCSSLLKEVKKLEQSDDFFQKQPKRILNLSFTHDIFYKLLETKWFEKFNDYLVNQKEVLIDTITPNSYRKEELTKISAFISSGVGEEVSKWIKTPFVKSNNTNNFSIYDYMETYPQSRALYNRILYISMLVNQYKHDKMRKKAAREKLWQAQNGSGFLCTAESLFSNSKYRQQCYKYLMEAEKILREDNTFKENISCFDYNNDGINEYVCNMLHYFAYINLIGGSINELEVLKNTGNYVDNFERLLEFDGISDNYKRGLFVDLLLDSKSFDKYATGKISGANVFAKVQYQVTKFNQKHHELELFAQAVYEPTKQPISLRKKYIINSDGMNIQYILKNESNKKLNVIFAIESNFAHTNFNPEDLTYYTLEAVNNNSKVIIDTSENSYSQVFEKELNNVDTIRLSDIQSKVSFAFEANEQCNYCFMPLIIKRPNMNGDLTPINMSFVSTMYWNIELEAGMETEKNISFTITNTKKEKHLS